MVPIHLSSKYVYFKGVAGQTITKTIKIRSAQNRPLKLEPSHFNLSKKVSYRIEEVDGGKIFLIHFTTIPGHTETYNGLLKLKTNYSETSENP